MNEEGDGKRDEIDESPLYHVQWLGRMVGQARSRRAEGLKGDVEENR